MVPQPLDRLGTSVHANVLVALVDVRVAVLGCGGIVPPDPAGADDQDVARVQFETLVFGDFVEVFDCYLVARHGVVFDAFFVGPGCVVQEDAAADDAASFRPVFSVVSVTSFS